MVRRPVNSADHELGHLLGRARRALNDEVHARLVRLGYGDLRVSHGAVFARIDDHGTRLTDLAERAGMTKQSMGELVEDLVAKGYLERAPDPHDARARLVRPTAKGRRHLRDARRVVAQVEAELTRRLGPARARVLREALREIAGSLDR